METVVVLACFLSLCFVTHAVCNQLHLFPSLSPQGMAVRVIGLVMFATGILLTLKFPELFLEDFGPIFLILNLFLLGHLYFQVFNLSETARRIRILVSAYLGLEVSPPTQGNATTLVTRRLERLMGLKQIVLSEGRYSAKLGVLVVVALILRRFERILFSEPEKQVG